MYNKNIHIMEGDILTKFICKKCGMIWYTSNTKQDQKCDECGSVLLEYDNYLYETELEKKSS